MKIIRPISAMLLALGLIIFGSNYFFHFLPAVSGDSSAGADLLQMMRDSGLMAPIALSHILVGILLLIPKTRTFGALMQLPLTIGIVSFHATMQPAGLAIAVVMLILNIGAMWDPKRILPLCS